MYLPSSHPLHIDIHTVCSPSLRSLINSFILRFTAQERRVCIPCFRWFSSGGLHMYVHVLHICNTLSISTKSFPFYADTSYLHTIFIHAYIHTDDQSRRREFKYPFSQNLREQSALQCNFFLLCINESANGSYVCVCICTFYV